MKNFLFLLLVLINHFFYAQKNNDYEITYHLTYVKDSLEQNYKYEEQFYLFLDNEKSYFLSVNKYKSDSILNAIKKEKQQNPFAVLSRKRTRSNFKFVLKKENNTFVYREKISGLGNFIYKENNAFKNNWTLIDETKKILDYTCHKASIKYGGRLWYAWYTTAIPINNGPYKFNGLPGLILELEDSKSQYQFKIASILKKEIPKEIFYHFSGNKTKTTRDKFLKTRKNYYYNPVKVTNGRMNYRDKNKERAFILNKRKNNNFIELL